MENIEVLSKKLAKLVKNYNSLKDTNAKLKAENDFLNKEIKNLKKQNLDLLSFRDKQQKVSNKIKKILSKIDKFKGI